jgi:hypothetical protein
MKKHNRPVPKDDQWSAEDVARVLANPAHVVRGIVTREQWVKAAVRMAQNEGVEACIGRIFLVFDESLGAQGRLEAEIGTPEFIKASPELAAAQGTEVMFTALLDGLLDVVKRLAEEDPKDTSRN